MEDDIMTGALTDNEELINRLGQLFEEEEIAAPLLKSDPLALLRSSLGALLHLSRCYALWQHDATIAPQLCHIRADLQHRLATETDRHHQDAQDLNLVSGDAIDFFDEELVANIKKEKDEDDCNGELTDSPITILASYSLTCQRAETPEPVRTGDAQDPEKKDVGEDDRIKQTSEESFIEQSPRVKSENIVNQIETDEFTVDTLHRKHPEKTIDEEIDTNKLLETTRNEADDEDVSVVRQPAPVIDLSSESEDNDDVMELLEKRSLSSVKKTEAELQGNFPCAECAFIGKKKSSLSNHMRIHGKLSKGQPSDHICNVCGYLAVSKHKLKIHKRVHTGEQPYECQLCSYSASQKGNLKAHIARTHSSAELMKLNKIKTKKKHTVTIAVDGDVFFCKLCKFKSKYKGNLAKHLRGVHKASVITTKIKNLNKKNIHSPQAFVPTPPKLHLYSCPLCDHKTPHAPQLKLHMKKHSLPRRAPQNKVRKAGDFPCDECDYRGKYYSYLIRHKKVHDDLNSAAIIHREPTNTTKPMTTDPPAAVVDASNLLIATEKKLLTCEVCNYKCMHRGFLLRHQMTHDGTAARRPPGATKNVKTNGTIEIDSKKMNGVVNYGKRKIESEDLDKSLKKLKVKADGIREKVEDYSREATGKRMFSCHRCSFKTRMKSNMIKHLELHSSNPIFLCSECGYKTLSSSRLTIHKRDECRGKAEKSKRPTAKKESPPSVKPVQFFCKECNFAAPSQMSLNSHMKRHVHQRRAREEALKSWDSDARHHFDFVDYKPQEETLGRTGVINPALGSKLSVQKSACGQQDPLEIRETLVNGQIKQLNPVSPMMKPKVKSKPGTFFPALQQPH